MSPDGRDVVSHGIDRGQILQCVTDVMPFYFSTFPTDGALKNATLFVRHHHQ